MYDSKLIIFACQSPLLLTEGRKSGLFFGCAHYNVTAKHIEFKA
jgi:hypothetical protein